MSQGLIESPDLPSIYQNYYFDEKVVIKDDTIIIQDSNVNIYSDKHIE